MKIILLLRKAGFNNFFLLLLAMVVLAWLFPDWGSEESPVLLKEITTWGVSLIFFFYGVRLNLQQLLKGLRDWKLHLLIQSTTFLLFPLLILLVNLVAAGDQQNLLWLGVFYLAALPSTVSSSVVMISIAGGNIPAGIFNASISSILGIVLTPLWMSLYMDTSAGVPGDFSNIIFSLALQVLLPLVTGLALNNYLGKTAEQYKNILRSADQFIILLIVFRSFAGSFYGKAFDGYSFAEIALLSLLMLLLFVAMVSVMSALAEGGKFSREDKITILFCGSKKSLVQGAVMGQVLFTNPVTLGVVLLPLMIYHALQLLAGSILAKRLQQGT